MKRSPVLLVDARALQDPGLQYRGVGSVITCLLRNREASGAGGLRAIGITSEQLPPLPAEFQPLFDEVTPAFNHARFSDGGIFLNPSPMTHNSGPTLRPHRQSDLLKVAVVYDFIPLDWPGYLPRTSDRIEFTSRLAWLAAYDLFTPISEYSANRLRDLTGVAPGCVRVVGAPVRTALVETASALRRDGASVTSHPPYLMTVAGADLRKNVETAIKATGLLRSRFGLSVHLKVVGGYGQDSVGLLHAMAEAHGLGGAFELLQGIDDLRLARTYAAALLTIVPSHIEGFSLPIVEAAVCGCPVIASQCAAHLELIDDPAVLFSSYDAHELASKAAVLCADPALRDAVRQQQTSLLATRFREADVRDRFWSFVLERFERFSGSGGVPFAIRHRLPRVALMSPFPPDASGVAKFTERTLQAGSGKLHTELYTDALRPLLSNASFRDAGPITAKALMGNTDATISVLGNSHFHNVIFDLFEHHGGPCILHDSRLTHIYRARLGPDRFREFASRLLGHAVQEAEIATWLQDRGLPSLFIEPVLERARPLIVHTKGFQTLIRERYGYEAQVTTFAPNNILQEEDLTPAARQAARRSLGLDESRFVIGTFGYGALEKGLTSCVIALDHLRAWNIPAELHLVGKAGLLAPALLALARQFDVEDKIRLYPDYVTDAQYRDYLVAADAVIQLRTYGLGQISAALVDSIAAGLPAVANVSLAANCDSPSYVATVPDQFSPLLIAEELATIWGGDPRRARERYKEERRQYCNVHNFDVYVDRLKTILGF